MAVLDRDAIRGVQDRTIKEVEVPTWGGSVCFGSLVLRERNRLMTRWSALDKNQSLEEATEVQIDVLIAVCCDNNGDALFTDDDRIWLGNKDAVTLEALASQALAFLGLSTEGHEEEVKNSGSTRTGRTKSDSAGS